MQHLVPIPVVISDLTAEWTQTVLHECGHDVDVVSVTVAPIGTGQMASSLRIDPVYGEPTEAPASLVVKMASADPNSRSAGERGAYLKEVRFYQELADSLPVATPVSYLSAIDEETNDFVIVLEDMQPAQQGDQIIGSDVESVRQAVLNIAGLHAPRWCDASLHDIPWLSGPLAERQAGIQEVKAILAMVTPGFIERYRNRINARHIAALEWFAATVDTWLLDDRGRFGLTHADHRLDNLLFNREDHARPVTVVDWQTIAVRNPVADVSYLLGTSLEASERREVERELVDAYHQQLGELGVTDFSSDSCFDDYRSQTPHSLLLTVLGSMMTVQTDRGDDMFMAMLHRSCDQMWDLDVL